VIPEQASLAQLHAALQVAFGWHDEHLYVFQICGWQFGDPGRAIELALAGGGVNIPLAAWLRRCCGCRAGMNSSGVGLLSISDAGSLAIQKDDTQPPGYGHAVVNGRTNDTRT
jgi:hypothetical protein